MGAWGVGSFEYDDASDWIYDFANAPSIASLEEALMTVSEWSEKEYLEVREASAALAAAEVVAAIAGKPNVDLPDDLSKWIATRKTEINANLIPLALQAIARVKSNSELNDSWIEEASRQDWYNFLIELKTRLT